MKRPEKTLGLIIPDKKSELRLLIALMKLRKLTKDKERIKD